MFQGQTARQSDAATTPAVTIMASLNYWPHKHRAMTAILTAPQLFAPTIQEVRTEKSFL